MTRYSSKMVITGLLLVIFSLVLMFQPLYTWAQIVTDSHPCRVALDPPETFFELDNMNPGDSTTKTVKVTKTGTSSANLYITWDFISGNPDLGELGSLFEQLILVISYKGEELYRGPMVGGPQAGTPSVITDALFIAFMNYGDVLFLDFTVILPGPETGNEFQGSTLLTKLVFYTICSDIPNDRPVIDIEKYTNGVDADVPTGPFIPVGGTVTWAYVVTNRGNVPLRNVVVTDNRAGVTPVYISGDTNDDGILQVGEVWTYQATGIATAGQYANIGTVVGTPPSGPNVADSDPSHYYGITPDETEINIEKYTNGFDADLPTGPQIPVGGNVTWTYVVTNPNTIPLFDIVVTDNRTGVNPVYISGDLNGDNVLQPNEIWTYRATGIAVAGQYANIGTVRGRSAGGKIVTDSDPSHYFGFTTPTPPPSETEVEPEGPEVSPGPDEIIIPPEGPKASPPLPRTDGTSLALFMAGFLLILVGLLLKKGTRDKKDRSMQN